MSFEDEYSFGSIRRGLERWWALRQMAPEYNWALITYLDLWVALAALPSGMRERLWHLLIMDGQHLDGMQATRVDDLVTGPIRRMKRFLNRGERWRR